MSQQDTSVMSDTVQSEIVQPGSGKTGSRLAVTGGILGGLAASACCVLPLALSLLGIGGAWMANLRVLGAFQPYFIGISVAALAYGFYQVYWKPKRVCAADDACASPLNNTLVKGGLWLGALIVSITVTFPYWFQFVLP